MSYWYVLNILLNTYLAAYKHLSIQCFDTVECQEGNPTNVVQNLLVVDLCSDDAGIHHELVTTKHTFLAF